LLSRSHFVGGCDVLVIWYWLRWFDVRAVVKAALDSKNLWSGC
jgi:hypothetical protein